jgi:pimeloyl-ACP methyl ester carboxylesterase
VTGPAGFILTHGAGGGADHHTLLALESGLQAPVRLLTFPYRAEGRRAPDRSNKLVPFIVEQTEQFGDELGVAPDRIVLGGRSMGGRMCSMAVAEGLGCAGLVLLSYPLHPLGTCRYRCYLSQATATPLVNPTSSPNTSARSRVMSPSAGSNARRTTPSDPTSSSSRPSRLGRPRSESRRHARISTGVPSGRIPARWVMSSLVSRTHPLDTALPIEAGSFVP